MLVKYYIGIITVIIVYNLIYKLSLSKTIEYIEIRSDLIKILTV